MLNKYSVTLSCIIIILLIIIPAVNVISDFAIPTNNEPTFIDNNDGNWTATWSLENPANYTINNITLSNGNATLRFHQFNFVEDAINEFQNGTWLNLVETGSNNLGLDLRVNEIVLIADSGNHRVVEIENNNVSWQYGNFTPGYGLNYLESPSFAVRKSGNKTLITDTNNNRVIEVGRNHEFYWQFGSNKTFGKDDNLLFGPSSAVTMANGNILIADTMNDYILESPRNKTRVWQYDIQLGGPTYAEEMANGSILITDTNHHKIIEVNRNKQIYWQFGQGMNKPLNQPTFATRLENGNTLITDGLKHHRVIEVDPAGNIIWEYGINGTAGFGPNQLDKPQSAIRLSNGNTLISDTNNHRVLEVTPSKAWVWQYGINGTPGSGNNSLRKPKSASVISKDSLEGYLTSQVLDGGDITNWTIISWDSTVYQNTQIQIYTRTGDSPNPNTGNWSGWSQEYQNSAGTTITSPINRYIQYKVKFKTDDMQTTPVLKSVTIKGTRFERLGTLTTEYYAPTGLLGWGKLTWNAKLNGQTIQSYYLINQSEGWQGITIPGDISYVPINTGKIKLKFEFSTSNTLVSPILYDFSLKFERLGDLNTIKVTPNPAEVIAGEQLNFSAIGYDAYKRLITINPIWTTTVGSITNGSITAQTTVGSGFVNATVNSVIGSGVVNVIPGPLAYIQVTPQEVILIADESQLFDARGYDKYGNEVSIDPIWETDVGVMEDNLFWAQNFAGRGSVTAQMDEIIGVANVTIQLNPDTHHPPRILAPVPNQLKPEDSEPWSIDLSSFEWDDEDSGKDLNWYMTSINKDLITLTGAYSEADELIFIPKADAFGNNRATLWLIDSDNMTANQTLWINITPVNDKPVIKDVPDIFVHYDEKYVFDYSNYIFDIETPKNELIFTIREQDQQKYAQIDGLNVSYLYPRSMFGQTKTITLMVSDGDAIDEEKVVVTITDNSAPVLIKSFPIVTMLERESKDNEYDLDDYFTDSDNDPLTYFFSAEFVSVTLHSNNSVTISSPTTWSGTDIITFRAMDPYGAMAEANAKVVVIEVNDRPQILPIPDIYLHYDDDYQLNLSKYIIDPDNETNDLSIWTSDPEHIKFHVRDKTLLVINYPAEFLDKTIKIRLYVSDGIDITSKEFTVHVTSNYPPIIFKKLIDISFKEDDILLNAFNLANHFSDKDDEKLSYSFQLMDELNISIVINPNNTVDFSSIPNWFGSSYVIFKAEDAIGAFIEAGFNIVVIPVNDAPTISPIPTQRGKVGERWILDLNSLISDIDNEISELKVEVAPEYLNYLSVTGNHLTFHGDKSIDIIVKFSVTDGSASTIGFFQLIITEQKETQVETTSSWMWISILIIILIILGSVTVMYRRQHGSFTVTDVFIIHKNGLLIKYVGDTLKKNMDEDIFSGMFTSIQSFISDSFSNSSKKENDNWKLNKLRMGDYEIMIEEGKNIIVTVIFTGVPGSRLPKMLSEIIDNIEKEYGDSLAKWDGRYRLVKGIEKFATPILTTQQTTKGQNIEGKKPIISRFRK